MILRIPQTPSAGLTPESKAKMKSGYRQDPGQSPANSTGVWVAHLTDMGHMGREQRKLLLKGDRQEAGSTSAELGSEGGSESQKPRKKQKSFHLRKGRRSAFLRGRCWLGLSSPAALLGRGSQ